MRVSRIDTSEIWHCGRLFISRLYGLDCTKVPFHTPGGLRPYHTLGNESCDWSGYARLEWLHNITIARICIKKRKMFLIRFVGQAGQSWERRWRDGRYQVHYLPALWSKMNIRCFTVVVKRRESLPSFWECIKDLMCSEFLCCACDQS